MTSAGPSFNSEKEHLLSLRRISAMKRDLVVLICMLAAGALSVRFFDTGKIAEWVAARKDTKIDEVIVVSFILAIGMTIFAIRRSIDLTHQIAEHKRLMEEMNKLGRRSAMLGEQGD